MSGNIKVNGLLFTWLKLNAFLSLQLLYNKYLLWRSLGKTQSECIYQLEIFQGDQNWGSVVYLVRSVRARLSNWMAWMQCKSSTGLHIDYQQRDICGTFTHFRTIRRKFYMAMSRSKKYAVFSTAVWFLLSGDLCGDMS